MDVGLFHPPQLVGFLLISRQDYQQLITPTPVRHAPRSRGGVAASDSRNAASSSLSYTGNMNAAFRKNPIYCSSTKLEISIDVGGGEMMVGRRRKLFL
ncbi:hypothetical protein ABVT39_024955 [Epinephelus coioides]